MNKSDADFVLLGGDFNVDPKARLQSTFEKCNFLIFNSGYDVMNICR